MKADTAGSTDDYSTYSLVRRLLVDEALVHWPRYALAFVLMAIAAAGTALTAYLLGTMTNEAYVNHNYHGIVVIGMIAMVHFRRQGLCHLRLDGDAVVDRQQHHRRQSAASVRQAALRKISASLPTGIPPNSSPGSPPAPTPSAA